ncbi:hypothetical protein F4779DRAFT_8850 [Xylariaceae sp. FL0662B]|nr:hypothetical protein F4779DRAFT_8850 [Xylariaceae sp. FL0662B]
MSLHRWSLPSRAFTRERSGNDDSQQRNKFPTVNIGKTRAHRRANLSSVFASLLEKGENHQAITSSEDGYLDATEFRPLSTRVQNIPSTTKPKSLHTQELQVISSDVTDQLPAKQPLNEKHDAAPDRFGLSSSSIPRVISRLFAQQDDIPKAIRSTSSQTEPDGVDTESKEDSVTMSIKSPTDLEKIRSVSSSYPSEGIRSPPDHRLSPEPSASSQNLVSEYSRYGRYPTRLSCKFSDVSTDNAPIQENNSAQNLMKEPAASGGVSETASRATSSDATTEISLCKTAVVESKQEECAVMPQESSNSDFREKTVPKASGQIPRREWIVPILDSETSSHSNIRVRFFNYRATQAESTSHDDVLIRLDKTDSTEVLCLSTETQSTSPTMIHQPPDAATSSTIRASASSEHSSRDPVSTLASLYRLETPGLSFPVANESSTTFVQRIQKFRFKKWVKKVCRRTKVRFAYGVKPGSSPKALRRGKSKTGKSLHPKKRRVISQPKRKSKVFHWKASKAMEKTRKQAKKQERGHGRFFSTLRIKKSIQFPITPSKVEVGGHGGHRRVQSCPP